MPVSDTIAPAGALRPDPVPRPELASREWLEAMLAEAGLDLRIAEFDVATIGAGQIGETARFTLRYAPGSEQGPATLIGKFASTDATSLSVARAWSLYEREVRFYRELAASARIAVPACYGAQMDAQGGFALLLEDLAPAEPGDQFRGLEEDAALRAVREAARLHAAFWDLGDDPALSWLDTDSGAQPFYGPEVFRSTWPQFRSRYRDRLSDDHRRVCDALFEKFEAYDAPRTRPRCITHNDFRPDNMLLGQDRLTVVDWQSVALGSNAVDVAYLIGGAYSPDARREAEPVLIAAYREELAQQGIKNQTRDEFEQEYRHFTFAGINVAVGAAMLVERTERGDRMFMTMLDRHVSHVLDAGALPLIGK